MISNSKLLLLVAAAFSLLLSLPVLAQETNPGPANTNTIPEADALYRESVTLSRKGDLDNAIARASDALKLQPNNIIILALLGDLQAKKHQWSDAVATFSTMLKLSPDNSLAKFDLAEMKLMQKQFDDARTGFLALEKDQQFGDLATYKVFLCDLFAQNELASAKELAAINNADRDASYYYANAAQNIHLGDTEEARKWLARGLKIYPLEKTHAYVSTLVEFGYLPLPPPK